MSLRILAAGGCHVVGYPIGKEHSFATVVGDQLLLSGIDTHVESIAYLPVNHLPRMVKALRSVQPDVTILQLGNYETTVTFRQYIRRKLGLKKDKASAATEHQPPGGVFRQTWLWKVKCGVKLIADTLLRHDLVSFESMESNIAALFDAVKRESVSEVIVLAPLPCADPLYMRYRERLSVVMQRLALTRGFLFIPEPLGHGNCDSYYVDATHLNALGQERLGKTLATVIANVCRSLPQSLVVR